MPAMRTCPGKVTDPSGRKVNCPRRIPPGARYCPEHAREYEARRGTPEQRGYDQAHRNERQAWQQRINAGHTVTCPRCDKLITPDQPFDLGHPTGRAGGRMPEHQTCNRSEGGRRGALARNGGAVATPDHIATLRARRDQLRTRRAGTTTAHITVVTGPPCSGKTTYVNEHAKSGDVVIDYDALAVALGSPDTHDHPEHLRPVVTATWVAAITEARRSDNRVWLVRVNPSATDLATATDVVTLDVPAEECKRRARLAGRPESWAAAIDAWWHAP